MLNKKHSIMIQFDENEALMKEIDQLVEERAKNIVRSMVDTAMETEIDRIIRGKMQYLRMSDYTESRIRELVNSKKGQEMAEAVIRERATDMIDAVVDEKLDKAIEKSVDKHFRNIAASGAVAALLDYFKKNT